MYTETNFPTKAALKRALADGVKVRVFQPGGMFEGTKSGNVALEGPHYPQPHKWYASATILDGVIIGKIR